MNLLLLFLSMISAISLVVVGAQQTSTAKPDIVFIVPDRSTPYPNGLHNGILTSAYGTNYTVEVVEYGNYDQAKSFAALNDAIDTPSDEQPQIYCIWPMDIESKELVGKLYETHNVPIIQINQLPDDWELDHLLGYAGPRDAERAGNAGIMIVDAMKERGIKGKVVALGYPASYGGYPLSINAFRESLDSSIEIVKEAPLARPDLRQSAYLEIVNLIDNNVEFNSVYAMDDDILLGAYEVSRYNMVLQFH